MAYRFNGSSDEIRCAIGPLGGITLGAQTFAMLIKINTAPTVDRYMPTITDAALTAVRWHHRFLASGNPLVTGGATGVGQAPFALANTALWYLLVATWSGSGNARF